MCNDDETTTTRRTKDDSDDSDDDDDQEQGEEEGRTVTENEDVNITPRRTDARKTQKPDHHHHWRAHDRRYGPKRQTK